MSTAPRVIVGLAATLVLSVAAACTDDGGAATSAERRASLPAGTILVEGRVADVIEDNVFTVGSRDKVLVVVRRPSSAIVAGATVELVGRLESFDVPTLVRRLGIALDHAVVGPFEGQRCIVADTVRAVPSASDEPKTAEP